ncbi:FRIGIDA-like protein 3 [Hibiscus syriacus]|uniref:FRIGIDA-like protein n=2 Tax=Hibiscus syriacus TaxID=106335 RepID=A0A6A3CM75_HIBSY|nr:FRIGIDA-like protein 3 [Hibiscus syriacus]
MFFFYRFYAMEDKQSVATLIDSTTSKIQQLQKAFAELESHRAVTLNLKWKELEEHFHGLEKSLKRRFHELEGQEKEFETKTRKSREMLKKREAVVVAKEQASLVRLQEKRDVAVFSITNALEKHRKVSPEEPADVSCDGDSGELSVEDKPPDSVVSESNLEDIRCSENGNFEVKSYPQLAKLCEEMDSEGLHKFISDNRKNLAALKEEIPWALKAAASPAHLVLESLKGFYPFEALNVDRKKDSNLLGLRRTCIMLMECLSFLVSNMDMVSVSAVISEDIKEQAKLIAEEWKPKLDALDLDSSNGNSLEAHAFLQLIATFGIASDFNEEELSRLIPMVSRRRQTADLCHSLGLSEKMPGVIEVLANSGRQIDAVNLAFAFNLTAQLSPVPLLKAYLKEAKKASSPFKPGNASLTAQTEFSERELAALKAVIKCIEEHNLEQQYPVDPLRKRVLHLEKVKADKKGATEAAKPQPKRPRANGAGYGPRVTNVAADRPIYSRVTDRYPQFMYDRPYVYPRPVDNHGPALLASATYNLSPSHGNYFGYQYQVPYLH